MNTTKHNIRPTPVLRGKAAKKFLNEINEISPEQQKFLEECKKLYEEGKKK